MQIMKKFNIVESFVKEKQLLHQQGRLRIEHKTDRELTQMIICHACKLALGSLFTCNVLLHNVIVILFTQSATCK